MIRSLLVLAGALAGLASVRAEDWPEFRGPTGQGLAKADDLPAEWSQTKNVVWKQDVPGSGWSSPVVVSGKVYLTTAVEDGARKNLSLRALCLDAKTGKIEWNVEVFDQDAKIAPRIHSKNSHASPTPIAAGDKLYVHFGHQGTACLDLSGKVLWTNRELRYAPVHGNGGSPVLADGLLVFSIDGASVRKVVALDAATGKVKWETARSGDPERKFSFSTPLVIEVGGKKQIVSPASDMVGAYDVKTGKELWKVTYEGYSVIPRPVFGHGLVFVSTGYNSPKVLAIEPGGPGKEARVRWRLPSGGPHTPSPLLVGGELYVVSDGGVARCLDARTGTEHWTKRLERAYSASPVHAGEKIYFLSENGVGTVVKAGKKFELVARNEMNERTLASYAVAENALYVRTAARLYRIGK